MHNFGVYTFSLPGLINLKDFIFYVTTLRKLLENLVTVVAVLPTALEMVVCV